MCLCCGWEQESGLVLTVPVGGGECANRRLASGLGCLFGQWCMGNIEAG